MNNLAVIVQQPTVIKRFQDVLGKNAQSFINSVISTVNNNPALARCEPKSILSAAIQAATLRLPVNPNLGQAYLVPYGNQCNFQLGWKGLIQLAQRTKRYKTIIAVPVYEGEIVSFNKFTEEVEYGSRTSDTLIGFFARFELRDGFSKAIFCSTDDMIAHAVEFSKSFRYDRQNNKKTSVWSTNFVAMGRKTILKRLLQCFGPIAIDDPLAQVSNDAWENVDFGTDSVDPQTIDVPFETAEDTFDEQSEP